MIRHTTIQVNAEDDSAIDRVEFSIETRFNRTYNETDDEAPYEWSFRKLGYIGRLARQCTLTVTAYDDEGKSTTTSMEFIAIFI